MKVLLVNGSPHERGCTYTALREAADAIEKRGIETEILWLGKGEIPRSRAAWAAEPAASSANACAAT